MSAFVRNSWYVAAWDYELAPGAILGREVAGQRLAIYRRRDGVLVALEDRCPHRHAPLSSGRLEGDELRCMYHGLRFDCGGRCIVVPGTDRIPPRLRVRAYPVLEKWSWIWVWTGDPDRADPALIPDGYGLDNPEWRLRGNVIDYVADHQLLHDNLLDLSHIDYVHETTLGASTGARWSDDEPEIHERPNGLHLRRWLRATQKLPDRSVRIDTLNEYDFGLPGIFVMRFRAFPEGTAARHRAGEALPAPLMEGCEQQAVTPVAAGRTRYFYATGTRARHARDEDIAGKLAGIDKAFLEDRATIEGQARNIDPDRRMVFIPQDKAPTLFRRMIAERLAAEQAQEATASCTA
jgi:phenylpropionate dioxygenase-like ring-hydroxylating dioxygenase large terminal subunit